MAGKRKPKIEDKEQSQRFVEIARKLEADQNGKAFERAFSVVVPKRSSKRRSKRAES